jgi:cytochrome oxidase Cu insertion factor (SCO1/SenC/PrrC family)
MKNRTAVLSTILLLVFVLAACGGTPDVMDEPTKETMMTEDAMITEEAMMTKEPAMTEDAMMETPDLLSKSWFDTSLKDVRSGEAFTINDFKGKVVLVETMAVWCPTCKQQQEQIKALYESLGMREDLVIVSLDIDPNEDEATLMDYTGKNNGFGWYYAVADPDTARAIGEAYGDQFLNPPSAPVLVIDRHGVAHPLPFGLKSAEDLMKAIQPYLDEKM